MVAERLRKSIGEVPIPCAVEGGALKITTSVGGAIINNGGHNNASVLERADKTLYEAKKSGRDCTIFEGKGKITADDYKEIERVFMAEDASENVASATNIIVEEQAEKENSTSQA